MKKLTQKLVLSVITMALVVVALGTSTFAWFTLQNSASVGSFQGQVTSGEGIEVSFGYLNTGVQEINYDGDANSVWYTAIPATVMQDFIEAKYPTFKFDNITSVDGENFTDQENTTATSGWVEFNLYFRSRTENLNVAWTNAVIGGTAKVWTVNSNAFTNVNNVVYGIDPDESDGITNYPTQLTVSASSAARVSITDNMADPVVVQDEALLTGADTTTVFNSTALPAVSYDLTGTTIGTDLRGASSYEKANGLDRVLTQAPNIPDALTDLTSDYNDGTTTFTVNGRKVLTLTTTASTDYFGGYVTVRVWIEGWDADTFDAIFETLLTVSLNFAEYEATAQ